MIFQLVSMVLLLKDRKRLYKEKFQWYIELFNDACLYLTCVLHMQFSLEPENTNAMETSAAKTIFGKVTMYLIMLNFGGNISSVVGSIVVEAFNGFRASVKYCFTYQKEKARDERHKIILEKFGSENMPSYDLFS